MMITRIENFSRISPFSPRFERNGDESDENETTKIGYFVVVVVVVVVETLASDYAA